MDSGEAREKLRMMVSDLYESCQVNVEVLYPKVLVRVLPKWQKIGRIYLPDNQQQNKPVLEGMVIKTWKPFYQKIFLTEARWVKDDPEPNVRYTQKVESALKPGDHVLFPHIEYGILPIEPLDRGKGDYRLVPEELIPATLSFDDELTENWLTNLIGDMNEIAGKTSKEIAEGILKNADVVRKDIVSRTISGR